MAAGSSKSFASKNRRFPVYCRNEENEELDVDGEAGSLPFTRRGYKGSLLGNELKWLVENARLLEPVERAELVSQSDSKFE